MKRPRNAVATASGNVAALSNEVDSGMGKVVAAGATVYCAYAPYYKALVNEQSTKENT